MQRQIGRCSPPAGFAYAIGRFRPAKEGGQHATDKRDAVRDRWLAENRYRVLRFWNNDVLGNMDGVPEMIATALPAESPPHPDR
jgi:Protein of unknown function (DUF559)